MKVFIILFSFCLHLVAHASQELLFKSEFRPLVRSVKVQGGVEIHRGANGRDLVTIHDFKLRGGVVLDLKVCGEVVENEYACISIGEPRLTEQSWEISYPFKEYQRVLIFDLDLIQNLAEAR